MNDNQQDNTLTDLDWENRVLCSDEACIGVIGKDGCCKECGRSYEGELPQVSAQHNAPVQDQALNQHSCASSEQPHDPQVKEGDIDTLDEEWAKRTLCSDESCIGVIGEDGRCKECRLVYSRDSQ